MMAPSGAFRPNLTTDPGLARLAGLAVLAAVLSASTPGFAQFSSAVNVVEVYATVTDEGGKPVTGLTQDQFVVRENGAPQQISTFSAGQFPLAVAVALDRSFSMRGNRLESARSAARIFLGELRREDESMLLAVGSAAEVVAPLTTDRAAQLGVLAKLDAFGTTGLHDAVLTAIDAIQQARGRRALVLLSDGADRYSTASADAVLERARASDVLIYPVAFGRERPALFAEVAALTGGRSFHAADARQLPETMRTIARELRHQYLIGYTPSRPLAAGSGEWRSIQVSVARPGISVRARDGYLVR